MNSTTTLLPPASSAESEVLAIQAVSAYLRACNVNQDAAIGNYLMKLVSVAAVVAARAEGSQMAADRLRGTADFVLRTMPTAPGSMRAAS